MFFYIDYIHDGQKTYFRTYNALYPIRYRSFLSKDNTIYWKPLISIMKTTSHKKMLSSQISEPLPQMKIRCSMSIAWVKNFEMNTTILKRFMIIFCLTFF